MTRINLSLTEYVEYLLMNPRIYLDHRNKYRSLLETITAQEKNPVKVAHSAGNSVIELSKKMLNDIQVPNLILRIRREEWKE